VCEMVRYAVDAGDEEEAEAGQEGVGELGDGARDKVGACGVRDDDDAGLGEGVRGEGREEN